VTNEEFKEDLIKKEFDAGNYKSFMANGFKNENITYIAKIYKTEQIKKDFVQNLRETNNCNNLLMTDLNETKTDTCSICKKTKTCFVLVHICFNCLNNIIRERLHMRYTHFIKKATDELTI